MPPQDLFGQGFYGAHGGSGLSSIGGTIRLGEMMPGAPPTRHGGWSKQAQHPASQLFSSSSLLSTALKIDIPYRLCIPGQLNVSENRWPAMRSGNGADDTNQSQCPWIQANPNGTQKGSLIAIPPRLLPGLGLQTDLARSLAWTLAH